MNAQAFLALVAAHPQPWHLMYPERVVLSGPERSLAPDMPADLLADLWVAAPAMAAAILNMYQWSVGDGQLPPRRHTAMELIDQIAALKASLPESLR